MNARVDDPLVRLHGLLAGEYEAAPAYLRALALEALPVPCGAAYHAWPEEDRAWLLRDAAARALQRHGRPRVVWLDGRGPDGKRLQLAATLHWNGTLHVHQRGQADPIVCSAPAAPWLAIPSPVRTG